MHKARKQLPIYIYIYIYIYIHGTRIYFKFATFLKAALWVFKAHSTFHVDYFHRAQATSLAQDSHHWIVDRQWDGGIVLWSRFLILFW
jgi:hypothetical protein